MLKRLLPLFIALGLAALAALLVWYQLADYKAKVTEGWELEDVLVAAVDLPRGSILDSASMKVSKMPGKFVFKSVLRADDMENVRNQEVMVPIERGEPIHWYSLRGVRGEQHLSKSVREGARAISIDVTERSSVGQWIRPNDRVDILGTFRDPSSNQMTAVTLLQEVSVLATGRTSGQTEGLRADTQYSTVTLLVLPEEAEILLLAQEQGSLYFTLRNVNDSSIYDERARTTVDTLITGERWRKIRERRAKRLPQIIRGIKPHQQGR